MAEQKGFLARLFPKEKAEEPAATGPRVPVTERAVFEAQREFELPRLIIKFRGICEWDTIYSLMVRWFKERKFEFHEKLYKSKPPELELDWFAERKKTPYIMDRVDINFHAFEVEEVEAIKRGKKRKMLKMQMTIIFKIKVITGYPDIFETKKWNTEFTRRLLDIYNKAILKKEIDTVYTDGLYYEVYGLHQLIKQHFEMEGRGNTY